VLQLAEAQLEIAAARIAAAGASSSGGANLDNADLRAEVVALMTAKDQFSADLSSVKTSDEIQKLRST
jgi:flagellar hook protein FlgE